MRLIPRTLGGQLIALLLVALAISQGVAFVLFSVERDDAIRQADRAGLLETTAATVRMLRLAPPELRAPLARAASSPRVQLWVTEESAIDSAAGAEMVPSEVRRIFGDFTRGIRVTIVTSRAVGAGVIQPPGANDLRRIEIERGQIDFDDNRYDVLVSVPFDEGAWLNAQTTISEEEVGRPWPTIVSTAIMGLLILVIVALTARRATRPLRALAARADALGRGTPEPPLPAQGPGEMRSLTVAFNRMQERLQRFVSDRTRMLAAMGHDLRTPLTSLKLRAELLDDEEARTKMTATLEEMQTMIEATLAFARDEASQEEPRSIDLAALIASIADDYADVGKDVRFADTARFSYRCRPAALKRAITNLIDNAVNYGERARVTLTNGPTGPVIAVEDRGPGIPADRLDDVFQPFVRLEESRNRATGGAGLGLSIARSIALAHGGDLVLGNRNGAGLRAEIRLPPDGVAGRDHAGA